MAERTRGAGGGASGSGAGPGGGASGGTGGSSSGARLENQEGVVKWFDPRKGFGFLVGPQGQDIFVHYSVIEGDGFRVLKDGSTVQYDAEQTGKGWKCTRVHRVIQVEVTDPAKRTYSRTPRRL